MDFEGQKPEQTVRNRSPRRTTRFSVRLADRVARIVITLGGIGTILSVCGVAVFLVVVAAPIFAPATIAVAARHAEPFRLDGLSYLAMDEERLVALGVSRTGTIRLVHLKDGATILEQPLWADSAPTALSIGGRMGKFAVGFADGSIRLGDLQFRDTFPDSDDPKYGSSAAVSAGEHRVIGRGVVARTPSGTLRATELQIEVGPATPTGDASPIEMIDHVVTPNGVVTLTLSRDRRLALHAIRERRSRIDGSVTVQRVTTLLAEGASLGSDVGFVRLGGQGKQAYVVGRTGVIRRFTPGKTGGGVLAETVPPAPGLGDIVACEWAKGRETLLLASATGRIAGAFLVRGQSARTVDGQSLQFAHVYQQAGPPPVALSASSAERCFAVLSADGVVSVFHVTTAEKLCSVKIADRADRGRLAFSPRADGILALTNDRAASLDLDLSHPEASLSAMFLPVWYEGYSQAETVWQSSNEGEPKFGLVPLVFGTLKATVYSMLFAAPLALLAAIYSSEFLRPRTRSRIKPTIELMAGLPSVVLGFVGAFVLAPFVAGRLPAVLCLFVCIPWTLLLAGHVWQMLPTSIRLRLLPARFWLIAAVLPLGAVLSAYLGPILEKVFFAGDIFRWLDGQIGTGTGGWLFFLLPSSALLVAWATSQVIDPVLRVRLAHTSHARASTAALGRFLVVSVAAAALAWLSSYALNAAGWDPRGSVVGPYDQRNALIVGFVMGFAIIPIIYTIAEDALTTVPDHLRSASLGAGATTWQTATRIVLPAAMSGLFSGVMVGLGRAVGETMIVLMAAGGTPILDWNPFNGFKTLSVNIANELPESAVGSTHYRVLFFSAVVLFVLTSVLNTIAEAVRIRFRRRAFQL